MARVLPIGLDIGTTAIRLLQLGGPERDLRVVEAGKFVIPQEVKGDPSSRRSAEIEGIRRLLRDRRFRGRETVMALAPEQLAVRSIRTPKMPAEELPTAVNWEVQNKFPFDTATAAIRHLEAGEVVHGGERLDEVIVLAAARRDVEEQIDLACSAGLDLVSLDAEPCAVFRGFERFLRRREDAETVTVLVDVGARTVVVISIGREICFIKTIPIGGAAFNRAVAECLDLAPSEAEALRRRLARRGDADGDSEPVRRAVGDAIRPHLEDLAGEIALCLRYFSVTFRRPAPESAIFTGGEAHDRAVPDRIGERLSLAPVSGDPLRGVRTDVSGSAVDRRQCTGEWATAVGLSLKGLALAGDAGLAA